MIDRDEVQQETIRVDRLWVQWDEKSEDLLFTSPAFKEKVQGAAGRPVLCEVGPFLDSFFETAQPGGLICIRGGEQEALQALTRSAGGGLASFSHAHFAGANGGMAMGAEAPDEWNDAPPAKDIVEETSEESFPASDSPAWTPLAHLGPPSRDAPSGEQ